MMSLALLLLPALALAQDAVKIEVIRKGAQGQSLPALILRPQVDATRLDATLTCGPLHASRKGAAKAGESLPVSLDLPVGAHRCQGALQVELADGSGGEMPLSFEVEVLRPLVVTVDRAALDIAQRRVVVRLDRVAKEVQVRAFDPEGALLGGGIAPAMGVGAGQPIEVSWSGGGGDLARLEVRGVDADGFFAVVDLFPWSYQIPHEDVIFASDAAAIDPAEVPKLTKALAEVNKVVARYGNLAPVKLYIAGYTDTVGDPGHNEALSTQRAAAIARWFRAQGFAGPIAYQGFGERALAVPTPDGTDEARNRRALYVVAAEAPAAGGEFPGASWKPL